MAKPKLTREQWLNEFTKAARPMFKKAGAPIPKVVRCSVGFPSKGQRSNVIGECWAADATSDGICEIFIRPSLQSETSRVAGVLTHELMHAALGHEEGHGKHFRKLMKELGLEGKATATTEGPQWHEWADPIIKELGKFPGAELKGALAGGKKKQTTRMLKLVCDECGWSCRTSAAHIHEGGMSCPLMDSDQACNGSLVQN